MAVHKDFRQLVKKAQQQGWKFQSTRNGHTKAYPPAGAPDRSFVVIPGSASDPRALLNAISLMKRRGFRP